MAYENLKKKYYITESDQRKMCELRRKWAFDDLMCELEYSEYDDDEMPTEEQVEDILDEYIDLRLYRRPDWELELESNDMLEAIYKVMNGNNR